MVGPEGAEVPGAGLVHPDPEEMQRIRAAEKERVKRYSAEQRGSDTEIATSKNARRQLYIAVICA